jgi:hypothetical protein
MGVFNQSHVRLGSYVQTRHDQRGRVYQIHHECPESPEWVRGQQQPVTQEDLSNAWASILVDGEGAVVAAVNTLVMIEPFTLDNAYAGDYFEEES